MSATDELRRMLDERGWHWWAGDDERKTLWESNGLTWEYFNDENGDAWLGFLGACEQDIAPEQAIEATLGRGTCEVEKSWHGESEMVEYRCIACDEYMSVEVVKPDGEQPPNFCPNCGRRVVE